jgi:hypothetical protein
MNSQTDDDFIKGLKAKEAKMKDSISTKKHEIAVIEKQMVSLKRVIEAFEGIKYGHEPKAKIAIPATYTKNLSWSEKVIWATKEIGGGFVDNITDVIARLEPELNKKAIKGMVTQYASQLKKSGNLRHEKMGIKYKYFI